MYKNLFTQLFNADGGNGGNGGDNQNQNNDNQNNNGDNSGDGSSNNGNQTIPYSRFKEVNDNYKTVKDQLDQLVKDKEKQDEDSKKKQGEFESLYNDLKTKHDPLDQQFKQYQETFKTILKTKMDSVPENMRDLVPSGNELEQLQWIENAITKGLFKTNSTQSFGNQGNNPPNNNGEPKSLTEALKSIYKK